MTHSSTHTGEINIEAKKNKISLFQILWVFWAGWGLARTLSSSLPSMTTLPRGTR